MTSLDASDGAWNVVADGSGNTFTATTKEGSPSATLYVEKRDTSGAVVWTEPLPLDGTCYHAPTVLGVADDGRVGVAVMACPVASGAVAYPWTVTLLDATGAVSSTFTTGLGTVLTMNRYAEVYALSADVGQMLPQPDPKLGWINGSPFVLRLIRPDGTDAWVQRNATVTVIAGALHATADGGLAGLTTSASNAAVYRLDRAGTLLWTASLPGSVSPSAEGNTAVLRDGSVAVTVDTSDVVQYGAGQVGTSGQHGRALLIVAVDGTPKTIVSVPAAAPGQDWYLAPTALSDGGVVVWEQGACPQSWAFNADLSARWERHVDAACAASIGSAAATADNVVFLGWVAAVLPRADFLDGHHLGGGTYYLLSIEP